MLPIKVEFKLQDQTRYSYAHGCMFLVYQTINSNVEYSLFKVGAYKSGLGSLPKEFITFDWG